MQADEGEVVISRGKSLGYLAQQNMLTGHHTIYEEVMEAKRDIIEMEERLRTMEQEMKRLSGSQLEDLMEQYHKTQTMFDQKNGYSCRSEIVGVLKGLGFSEDEFSRQERHALRRTENPCGAGQTASLLQAPTLSCLTSRPTTSI